MAQVINTNVASLNAQRNLNKSQSMLSTSLQRLSSGMRINSAKDDAAGLAISERFTAQIRGLNQAARNSNDGISLAQTAEGALGEVTNNLQRIRELAVQSANATNSASDRLAMQEEVTQLMAEVERVANQSNFNGVKLLDGSFSSQVFQVGANVGETITVASIVDATATGLGLDNSAASRTNGTAVTGALLAGDLTVNGVDVGAVARDAKAIAAAITASSTGVTATATNSISTGTFATSANDTAGDTYTLTVAGVDILGTSTGAGTINAAMMDTAVSAGVITSLATAGITTTGTFAAGNRTFIDADGDNIVISEARVDAAGSNNTGGVGAGTGTNYGSVNSITSAGADLVIAGADSTKAGLSDATATASTNTLNVTTVAGANSVITAVDAAINSVNSARGTLGAIQNRFESVVTSLQTSAESLSSARSRIQDADFAQETANLTKAQILQQAGVAMIAQANSLPQNVLSLLQ
ncbi:MAG: flagellin [SAR86 cluster bacterium]|uniref:Flagellin n=1 Tax=SAR86 cluster bacterium TaxID=2030880 RepID=A0A2A4XG85_9GAMM|nr:MAG: flagellin [SAR86 cluster bacterium]